MAATTLPALILGGEVGRRPGRRVRELEQGAARCRPCRAWWSAARCSTRPDGDVAARRRRARWACCDATATEPPVVRRGERGRRAVRAGRHARRRPAGATAACGSWSSPPGGSAHVRHRRGRDARAAAGRRLHGRPATASAFELTGRASVFAGVTDFAYVPRDAEVTVSSARRRPVRPARRPRDRRLPPATARPRASRSSCAAPGRPAARSTTSARRTPSRPTS